MRTGAILALGLLTGGLPLTAWAQDAPMSADEIARMLKPGVALSDTSSDVMSADAIAAALQPQTPAGLTRSIVPGVSSKQSAEPEKQRTVNLQVNFATSSSRISPEARAQLDQLGLGGRRRGHGQAPSLGGGPLPGL